MREHGSPVVRALFFCAGLASLGFGIAGIFLPVVPTTPLVLLAATCFARSYRPFHEWLIAHRLFGPIIDEWHTYGSIPYRTKVLAIAAMAAGLAISIVFFVKPGWLKLLLATGGIALGVWLYRIPSRNRPVRLPPAWRWASTCREPAGGRPGAAPTRRRAGGA